MRRSIPPAPYDVAIVGARPAGAATALLLARHGLRVLLIDRGRYGADTLSTHALMRAGVLQLARWGLLDAVIAAGTPPVRRVTFRYAGETVPIAITPTPGVDALYAPRRTVLDPILVDAAVAAGTEVRFGTAVTDLLRGPGGVVTGVVLRTGRGDPTAIGARLVVGADGIRSTVAGRVGAPVLRAGTGATAITYGYWTGLAADGYEWNFRPGAASGVIPTNDGRACVFAGATSARVGRGGLGILQELVAASAPDLADRLAVAEPPTVVRTFPGRPGHLRRAGGPGWALVGDAGYYKDALSAHGLTDALRDAELLARAVVAIVTDGVPEREALADYEVRRDALSTDLFDVTDVIAGHRWTDAEIGALLLRLNAAMRDEVDALVALPQRIAG